jgi:hypothetical protein
MSNIKTIGVAIALAAVIVFIVMYVPSVKRALMSISGFENEANTSGMEASYMPPSMNNGAMNGPMNGAMNGARNGTNGNNGNNGSDNGSNNGAEPFANPSEPSEMPFAAGNAPSNCYPKNQLNAKDLLPADPNSKWAQVNPQGAGDIAGKNYLNAGALIGVNTVGQSLRNASWDLRSEPANPQVAVSPWFNSTIEPDVNRRTLEIA